METTKKEQSKAAFEALFAEMGTLVDIKNPLEHMRRTLALVKHFEQLYDQAFNAGHKVGRTTFYYTIEKN